MKNLAKLREIINHGDIFDLVEFVSRFTEPERVQSIVDFILEQEKLVLEEISVRILRQTRMSNILQHKQKS